MRSTPTAKNPGFFEGLSRILEEAHKESTASGVALTKNELNQLMRQFVADAEANAPYAPPTGDDGALLFRDLAMNDNGKMTQKRRREAKGRMIKLLTKERKKFGKLFVGDECGTFLEVAEEICTEHYIDLLFSNRKRRQ